MARMLSRRVSSALLLPLIAVVSAQAQTGLGFAFVGIAAGQSAQVSALNLGTRSSTPDSSCNITLQFLDAQGGVLKSSSVSLGQGKGAHLDLSRDQIAGTAQRAELRAVLLFGYSGGAPPGPDVQQMYDCNIAPSLEVYDNASGKTSFVLTDAKPLPASDPRKIAAQPVRRPQAVPGL